MWTKESFRYLQLCSYQRRSCFIRMNIQMDQVFEDTKGSAASKVSYSGTLGMPAPTNV